MATDPTAAASSNALVRALRAPFEARTWKETLHLLLNLPIGVVTFTIVVTGLAVGLGLAITLVGIPILIGMLYVSRGMGTIERARAEVLLEMTAQRPYRRDPPRDTWWRIPVARAKDPAAWREVAYHVLLMPFGVVTFTIVVTFWALGLGLLLSPVLAWTLSQPTRFIDGFIKISVDSSPSLVLLRLRGTDIRWIIDTPLEFALVSLIGLVLLFLAPWVVRGLAAANRAIVRGLLGRHGRATAPA